jgi:hypothetical protein
VAGHTLGAYTHSGKLGLSLVLVPIVAFIASVVLGVVYAYLVVYVPAAGYISILFVAGFAFLLGWLISISGYAARCRSTGFLHVAGLIFGAFALYVSWAAFTFALLKRSDIGFHGSLLDVFRSPGAIWSFAKAINAEGWYKVLGITPKGALLWIFWVIEALIVILGAAIIAGVGITGRVFCERCNRWCTTTEKAARLGQPQDQSQLAGLGPSNLAPLMSLSPAPESANPHIRVDTWHCPKCRTTAAVQAKTCSFTLDRKGKREEKTEDLTPVCLVSPETLQEIKTLAARPSA